MSNTKIQPKDVFKSICEPEISKKFDKKISEDALSIVVDAINSSVNGLIITDLAGIIRYVNPAFCKMFGYSASEAIGKDAADLFTTSEVKRIIDVLSLVDKNKNNTEEFIVKGKSNSSFVVEVSASSVTSISGDRIGRMASFIEITNRKIIEAEMQKKLEHALSQVKILSGLLPICSSCKKIRDNKGNWVQPESYISKNSEADFTHGICQECANKLYPELNLSIK